MLGLQKGPSPNFSEVFRYLSEPQLPAYLLAIVQGVVKIPGHSQIHEYSLQAGYITLKSEKDLKLDRLGADAEEWQDLLNIWEKRLAELGHQLQRGVFQAKPLPAARPREQERLCSYCGLLTICNRQQFAER